MVEFTKLFYIFNIKLQFIIKKSFIKREKKHIIKQSGQKVWPEFEVKVEICSEKPALPVKMERHLHLESLRHLEIIIIIIFRVDMTFSKKLSGYSHQLSLATVDTTLNNICTVLIDIFLYYPSDFYYILDFF
jgi:hypothetical protein